MTPASPPVVVLSVTPAFVRAADVVSHRFLVGRAGRARGV